MSAQDVLKRIEAERNSLAKEVFNAEGLVRLQDTMAEYNGEYQLIWSTDLLKEIADRPEVKLHQTGVKILDDVIGGFKEQQLITIGGDTGHGKTQMGLFLMEQLTNLHPVMIPLEQSAEEIVSQRKENGYSIPKFLAPKSLADRVTVEWIEERVVEGIAKHNTKLVLLDHLGYINDQGKGGEFKSENTAYRIGQVMKGLKNIAKKWNVIILLLVHISQHDEGKPPSREDIKNSSDIAQESDMVVLLWRKNSLKKKVRVYENKTMFSIQKNRRTGRNATIGLRFDTDNGRYVEDNGWIDSMVKSAESAVEAEDLFDSV
jgi:replicative DNA helicase